MRLGKRDPGRALLIGIAFPYAVLLLCVVPISSSRAGVFPGAVWETRTPAQVGLDAAKLQELQNLVGGSGMIVRGGYQVWTWGDIQVSRNWASASKPVISTLLFLATSQGLCTLESTMGDYHAGGSAKDRSITFHHLANMISGYSRGEAPGAAWAYNDHAINLYGYTLYHEVFGDAPSDVVPSRLSFLQFQGSFAVSDTQYGRLVGVSIRDFARIGLFWLNRGTWNGISQVPSSYFDLVTNQVSPSLPLSTADGPESWNFGSFGGGDNQDPTGPGRGEYGYNFWVNTNGFWPGAPSNVFAAVGHGGVENCIVFPSLDLVAVGVGSWGHPSTGPVNLLLAAVQGATSVDPPEIESVSWGAIKSRFAR
jgi:CubicO group peptidase (beta-lactamase class C family)